MGSKVIPTASSAPKNCQQVCRLCMSEKYLEDVFEQADLAQWISRYLSIEVTASDEVSKLVCVICSARLKDFREFQRSCHEVQHVLQKEASKHRTQDETAAIQGDVSPRGHRTRKQLSSSDGPKKYGCSVCSKSFFNPSGLKRHMQTHSSQTVEETSALQTQSPIAKKQRTVVQKATLKNRIKNKNHPCPDCPNVYKTRAQMCGHWRQTHGPRNYKCSLCSKAFYRPSTLKLHQQKAHNLKELDHSSAELQPRVVLKEAPKAPKSTSVVNDENESFRCDVCDNVYKSRKQLYIHKTFVHGPKKFKCSVCGKAFTRKASLSEHLLTHQPKAPTLELLKDPSVIKCELCLKPFYSKLQFRSHRRKVHGPRNFSCTICSKSFIQRHGLEIHLRSHKNSRPTKQIPSFKALAKRAPFKELPFTGVELKKCPKTDDKQTKDQPTIAKLKETSVASDRPKKLTGIVKCNECDEEFDIRSKLHDHKRTIHAQVCNICEKAFVSRQDLVNHPKVHQKRLAQDNHCCTICSARFASQPALNEHLRLHEQATTNLKGDIRTYLRRSASAETQENVVSSSDVGVMKTAHNVHSKQLTKDRECTTSDPKEICTTQQPKMADVGYGKTIQSERKSPVDKPIQQVACTICNQLINPSLTSLRQHLRTHDVAQAGRPAPEVEAEAVFEVEVIKVEPFTIDED